MGQDWVCADCNELIADGEGGAGVDVLRVMDVARAIEAWEDDHRDEDGTVSFNVMGSDQPPDPVGWAVQHTECARFEGQEYVVPVEHLRDPWELVRWTAHLMEKNWLPYTDWDSLLQAAYDSRPR